MKDIVLCDYDRIQNVWKNIIRSDIYHALSFTANQHDRVLNVIGFLIEAEFHDSNLILSEDAHNKQVKF